MLSACASPTPAEVLAVGSAVERGGLESPTVKVPDAGEAGPYACPGELGTPLDGGFTISVPADPDAAVVGGGDPPGRVHVVLGADGAHEMTLVWETKAATIGGRAQIGVGGDGLSWTIPGVSYVVGAARVHVVRVCGLEAAHAWSYRVGSDDGWSPVYGFRTAPEAGVDEPVRFAVLGDSRDGPETFQALNEAMIAAGVDFVAFTGDAVPSGTSWSEWEEWIDAGGAALPNLPMIFVPGNHEFNDLNWFALFPTATGRAHEAINYGPVHLAVVDDTANSGVSMTDEATWLATDLATATAPWVIPAWHKPAVSSCKPHGEDPDTKKYLLPVVEAAPAVKLVINGHNHNYERSAPVRGGVVDPTGIVHLVSGGAGAPLYTSSYGYGYTEVEVKLQHWVLMEADATTLHGTAYDVAGNVIDDFTLLR